MALGLHVGARLPDAQSGARPKSGTEDQWAREELLSDLAATVTEFLSSKGLQALATTKIAGEALLVTIHPASRPVKFTYEDGTLSCQAQTSSVGPGYHAVVADMLHHVAGALCLSWNANDTAKSYGDDTGYFEHRNFANLQVAMAQYLTRLSGFLMSPKSNTAPMSGENVQLSIPVGFPTPAADFFAMSPMGYWDRKTFEDVAKGSAQSLASVCAAFFPWWENEVNAVVWRNAGLCMLWTDVPWHPPANEDERAVYTTALRCFQRAFELDKNIILPKNEMAEMAMFVQMPVDTPAPLPQPNGKGFLRGKLRRQLLGDWSAELPGYFYAGFEKEGQTALFWHNGMMLRATAYNTLEELARQNPGLENDIPEDSNLELVAAVEKDHMVGRAYLLKKEDEKGRFWALEGRVTSEDGLCFMSLTFPPDEHHLDWATKVFSSVELAA